MHQKTEDELYSFAPVFSKERYHFVAPFSKASDSGLLASLVLAFTSAPWAILRSFKGPLIFLPKFCKPTRRLGRILLSASTTLNQVVAGEKVSVKFILTGLGNWAAAWKLVEAGVREAEKQGFWGAVFPDQYMWDPEDLGADSYEGIDHTLDTWVALSHLAAQTKRIHLGTWVTPIPLRPPGILAKIVSTLDVLSDGRSILGVGAGITQRLFEAYSEWDLPKVRVGKTKEGVELFLKLWAEEKVDFKGHHYVAKGAVLDPKPIQKPHPPLLFGGAGRRMLRLAGQYADICYVPPWNKMSFEESKKIVLQEAERHGREDKVSFAAAYTPLGPGQGYDREQYRREVEKANKAGFSYFITAWNQDAAPWEVNASSLQGVMRSYMSCLTDFAENVMPDFQ